MLSNETTFSITSYNLPIISLSLINRRADGSERIYLQFHPHQLECAHYPFHKLADRAFSTLPSPSYVSFISGQIWSFHVDRSEHSSPQICRTWSNVAIMIILHFILRFIASIHACVWPITGYSSTCEVRVCCRIFEHDVSIYVPGPCIPHRIWVWGFRHPRRNRVWRANALCRHIFNALAKVREHDPLFQILRALLLFVHLSGEAKTNQDTPTRTRMESSSCLGFLMS